MKIAWFTPFSATSAIGQYSAVVVLELSNHADVTIFALDISDVKQGRTSVVPVRPIADTSLETICDWINPFDIIIYNLGDHLYLHQKAYETMQRRTGIVILHDLVMHHFFYGYYLLVKKDVEAYVRALFVAHGPQGAIFGQSVAKRDSDDVWFSPDILKFHMAQVALDGACGVVVHSQFARQSIVPFSAYPVKHINFPNYSQSPASAVPSTAPNRSSHLDRTPAHKIRLLTFGVINPNKQVDQVIRAFGSSKYLRQSAIYYVLGTVADSYQQQLERLISGAHLEKNIILLGYQPDDVLHDYLQSADIVINLRNPHFGESSASLLEAAMQGKPIVIWNHGSYAEFPDDTVAKISNSEELVPTLERLCKNPAERQRLGTQALAYAKYTFDTERYCRELLEFIDSVQYDRSALAFADSMSEILTEMGADETAQVVKSVSDEIAMLITVTEA